MGLLQMHPVIAFGYICGYISYDEYLIHAAPLAVYLQNEYDSWETMYESYYYGYLILQEEIKTQAAASSIVTIDITRSWQIRQRFRFGQKRDNLTTGIQEYYYENRYYIRHTQQHLRF